MGDLAKKRLYVVFGNGPQGPPGKRVYGPYNVVEFIADDVYVAQGLFNPQLLAVRSGGRWSVCDGLGEDSPDWETVRVVSPHRSVSAEDLARRL
jgi:hypothetical protein